MPPEWRTWRLIKLMGAPPSTWEDEPAYRLDALLAIDGVVNKVTSEAQSGSSSSRVRSDDSRGAGGYVE